MLDLDIEWLEAPAVANAELRETWARLSVRVEDATPCALLDDASGSVRTSLYLPLYPLAEWFAYHWWTIFYESYSTSRDSRAGYHFRHSFIGAAEGFLLPDLAFYPMGDFMQLLWHPRSVEHASIRFLNEGLACLDKAEVMRRVTAFIDSVVNRLEARNIYDSALQLEWAAVRGLSVEERRFCQTSAQLGIDPFNAPDGLDHELTKLQETLAPSAFQELLSAVPSESLARAAQTIQRFRGKHPLDLKALRHSLSRVGKADWKQPWEVGYRFAEELRGNLKLRDEPLADEAALAHALGAGGQPLYSGLSAQARPNFSAITRSLNQGEAFFGVASSLAANRRFAFCRALFPFLIKDSGKNDVHLVTSGHTPMQQAGRAFAAEFLAPRNVVSEKLGNLKDDYDCFDEVAKTYGVSSLVIENQNRNARRLGAVPVFAY